MMMSLLILFTHCNSSLALTTSKDDWRVQAQDYYLNQRHQQSQNFVNSVITLKDITSSLPLGAPICEPGEYPGMGPSCVERLCRDNDCSDRRGRDIAESCRGADGRCVDELCKKNNCKNTSTARDIAETCRGASGYCVQKLCQFEDCYGNDGKMIADSCVGADYQCVNELCKHNDCHGNTGQDIARACSGR